MPIISAQNVSYSYEVRDEEGNVSGHIDALQDITLDISAGSFITVLGHNGSGKSTFAKQLNALLVPTGGTVFVDGMNTADDDNLLAVRKTAGMVFQNPDNQMIASNVEEEIGFGPENIGVEPKEIWKRVDKALRAVGMTAYRQASPNKLSGGQKQRIAIASIVAMEPKCIVLDEPTAMLDPGGRKEVLAALHELNAHEEITIILITHNMEEVVDADYCFVIDDGKLVMRGTPRAIFSNVTKMKELRLDVPQMTEVAFELQKQGIPLPDGILRREELVRALQAVRAGKTKKEIADAAFTSASTDAAAAGADRTFAMGGKDDRS